MSIHCQNENTPALWQALWEAVFGPALVHPEPVTAESREELWPIAQDRTSGSQTRGKSPINHQPLFSITWCFGGALIKLAECVGVVRRNAASLPLAADRVNSSNWLSLAFLYVREIYINICKYNLFICFLPLDAYVSTLEHQVSPCVQLSTNYPFVPQTFPCSTPKSVPGVGVTHMSAQRTSPSEPPPCHLQVRTASHLRLPRGLPWACVLTLVALLGVLPSVSSRTHSVFYPPAQLTGARCSLRDAGDALPSVLECLDLKFPPC